MRRRGAKGFWVRCYSCGTVVAAVVAIGARKGAGRGIAEVSDEDLVVRVNAGALRVIEGCCDACAERFIGAGLSPFPGPDVSSESHTQALLDFEKTSSKLDTPSEE